MNDFKLIILGTMFKQVYIHFILRCWYFYDPVAFLLLISVFVSYPKNVVQHPYTFIHIGRYLYVCIYYVLVNHIIIYKAIIISEVFWRKFYDFFPPLDYAAMRMRGKNARKGRRHLSVYFLWVPRDIFLTRIMYKTLLVILYRNRKSHYCSAAVTFILGAR